MLCLDLSKLAVGFNIAFTVLNLFFFALTAMTEPGYIRNENVDFMEMLNVIDSTQLCPDCETIRTSRSRHCSVCGYCIERFDHHCPWINNCVGIRNHNYFFMYVLTQAIVVYSAFSEGIYAMCCFLVDKAP